METKKIYNFSTIKFADLEEIVQIKGKVNDDKFKDWFETPIDLTIEENALLEKLIHKHRFLLASYMEEDLKAKFLIPILNQVDFMMPEKRDWYDAVLSGVVNGAEFKGFADYMVASGTETPRKPYFFIQEFKPSVPDRDPRIQLLAELLVAIEKNKTTVMRGGYVIGQFWHFMIVEKIGENQFEYFISQAFDALKIAELKQIYIALQAVKHKYCVD